MKNSNKTLEIEIPLYGVYLKQDDPKKNTIVRLANFNLVNLRSSIRQCPRYAIILDPFASQVLSKSDRSLIQKSGVIVMDCSWAKTETIFRKPFRTGRRLPPLIAVNPVNYGRWNRLSSAEALAASLYITGFAEEAALLLSKFSWGLQFYDVNQKNFQRMN